MNALDTVKVSLLNEDKSRPLRCTVQVVSQFTGQRDVVKVIAIPPEGYEAIALPLHHQILIERAPNS